MVEKWLRSLYIFCAGGVWGVASGIRAGGCVPARRVWWLKGIWSCQRQSGGAGAGRAEQEQEGQELSKYREGYATASRVCVCMGG